MWPRRAVPVELVESVELLGRSVALQPRQIELLPVRSDTGGTFGLQPASQWACLQLFWAGTGLEPEPWTGTDSYAPA